MKELWLSNIPTARSINTAIHQDEGVILDTNEGLRFAFVPQVPQAREGNDQVISGHYNQIIDEQFSEINGQGELIISDVDTPEPSARLVLLDRDEVN